MIPGSLYGDELRAGALCGDYVIESQLGAGGWARVYLARHRVLKRVAAVKVLARALAQSAVAFERFVWEAQVACRVQHPAIVDVYDLGRLPNGRPYIVMEYIDGDSLETELQRDGRFSSAATLEVVDQLAAALEASHAVGVVHRDVKPSNVMRHAVGGAVKLVDFGIAKLIAPEHDQSSPITTSTTRLGSPEAMAPEQIRGQPVTPATDVYGLGVLTYRLLTAAWPFAGVEPEEIERLHLEAVPLPVSHHVAALPQVDAVVAQALAKASDERFAGPSAFAGALRAAVAG